MNPFIISLALLISLICGVSILIILPCFNLNIVRSNTVNLRNKIQTIIDEKRNSPKQTIESIESLKLTGVNIQRIESSLENDYIKYKVIFNFNNLFTNKFFDTNYKNKKAFLEFIAERN